MLIDPFAVNRIRVPRGKCPGERRGVGRSRPSHGMAKPQKEPDGQRDYSDCHPGNHGQAAVRQPGQGGGRSSASARLSARHRASLDVSLPTARWLLGPCTDIGHGLTAFHPDFKLRDRPPTPPATLARARRIAHDNGVRHA